MDAQTEDDGDHQHCNLEAGRESVCVGGREREGVWGRERVCVREREREVMYIASPGSSQTQFQ